MKKNLITVIILALVLANLVLTSILTISILPQTKKANELITQVCSAIDLELKGGANAQEEEEIPLNQIQIYNIPDSMTINLKDSGDGQGHYAVINVSLSLNTKGEGYSTYGENIAERESLIKSEIVTVVSEYTYEEFNADKQGVQDAILKNLQKLFDSDFIVSVGFPTVTCQ